MPEKEWSTIIDLSPLKPASQLEIELLSKTWAPIEVIAGSLDSRKLGVAVKGVTLR